MRRRLARASRSSLRLDLSGGASRRWRLCGLGVYVCVLQGGGAGGREGRDMVSVSVGGVERLDGVEMGGGSSAEREGEGVDGET